jgi:cell division protein FtsL
MNRVIDEQAGSIVRERDRRRLRAMIGALGLGGLLVGGVLGYVWLQVQRVRVSYELEDLRALRTDVEEQNKKLHLELYSLRSFARVDAAARRLGLTEPAPEQVRLAREFLSPRSADELAAHDPGTVRTAAHDGFSEEAMPGSRGRP